MVTGTLLAFGHSFLAKNAAFGMMVTDRILGEKLMYFFPLRSEVNSLTRLPMARASKTILSFQLLGTENLNR